MRGLRKRIVNGRKNARNIQHKTGRSIKPATKAKSVIIHKARGKDGGGGSEVDATRQRLH